jgi:hypothetical protein
MADVPRRVTSSRQQIHNSFCPSVARCRYRLKGTFAGPQCKKLDELLDLNDELVLHAMARRLEDEIATAAAGRRGQSLLGGLSRAVELVDPFEKVEAFDPELYEVPPGIDHPNCEACKEGREHYHRKSDGSPVVMRKDET